MLRFSTGNVHGTGKLLAETRELLNEVGLPWVIENVPGAPMRADFKLCGCMFGLPGLRRERWFETSWHGFELRPQCSHSGAAVTVSGHGMQGTEYRRRKELGLAPDTIHDVRAAMGIDWMNRNELAQAIPPAYTAYLGSQLLSVIGAVA